ncbi:Transport protein particle subunit bet5 OS=Schizosaccharomyces pombe (strain 972 / ATCC 24843) GN=bet5 PE=3 SV=2 [Rhizoctonia solani AG-1 IB]|uniref:Trafficking protein particle complex subunit n=1 Tax=Thanatephorus cucumeris (strain AG1-IB / isolate 7/3/14) TaxID=1108050 RepID=A0A0B7FRP7_THACB|nr:Transport protein particle subunit bet5 OS=Schizosaccharomyces pombe (strain 972 / ATCC 24843) GN=bet5 PE=3 SV=2 [Rhizoctonia solani AG-1 IB]
MTIYSLYIYDRHCACVFYQDWHRTKQPRPAPPGGMLSDVSQLVEPSKSSVEGLVKVTPQTVISPRNTLSSSTGLVIAYNEPSSHAKNVPTSQSKDSQQPDKPAGLAFDEEAKLVYGVLLSLRHMVQKLSGRSDEAFSSYTTAAYKLHYFETMSGYKFIMLTDPSADALRFILRQIYTGPFIEHVVRNPLAELDSRTRGIDNPHFRAATDKLVQNLSIFA